MRIIKSFKGKDIPIFPITLCASPPNSFGKKIVDAGVDTGFGGFVSVSKQVAKNMGLNASDSMRLTLGNRKPHAFLYCLGRAEFGAKMKTGTVIISDSDEVLIGMKFLRQFELHLIVDPISEVAILTDEDPPIQAPDPLS